MFLGHGQKYQGTDVGQLRLIVAAHNIATKMGLHRKDQKKIEEIMEDVAKMEPYQLVNDLAIIIEMDKENW